MPYRLSRPKGVPCMHNWITWSATTTATAWRAFGKFSKHEHAHNNSLKERTKDQGRRTQDQGTAGAAAAALPAATVVPEMNVSLAAREV